MLDFDFEKLYGYETKRFNEQINRNKNLFTEDEIFLLSKEDINNLSRLKIITDKDKNKRSRSQIATINATLNNTNNKRGYNLKYLPYAFRLNAIKILPEILRKNNVKTITELIIEIFIENSALEIEPNSAIKYEMVKYENGDFSLDVNVSPDEDTVWLNQNDIALLFGSSKNNISEHIKHIFDENELDKNSVVKEFLTTGSDNKTYLSKLL